MISILGHRGNPALHPDNTLAGLRSGVALSDGVEVDFRRAGSGELVLAHDPVVVGLTVAESTVAQLREAAPDLATADELFDEDLDGILDLEVKNWPIDPGFEPDHRVALEVAERARPGDIVTCFFWPTADAVKSAFPSVRTGLLFEPPVDWALAIAHAVAAGHEAIAPHHALIDGELMTAATAASVDVAAWTVNDRVRVMELAELGVQTIITNEPAGAAAWTREYQK